MSKTDDPEVRKAIQAEVRRQLRLIQDERAVGQYFQQQLQGIVYSTFIRFVFKLDEYLKGTRNTFSVGLWYLFVITSSIVGSVYIQSHFMRDPAYARYRTALTAIGVVLQYIVQCYFVLLVGLLTGAVDVFARDIDWLTLEISTVAICIAMCIMLSNAFFSLTQTPASPRLDPQPEYVSELVSELVADAG